MLNKSIIKQPKRFIGKILRLGIAIGIAGSVFSGCGKVDNDIAKNEDGYHFLDNKFTDNPITDEKSAIDAVYQCSADIGYTNALNDLTPSITSNLQGETYYRLQQNYKDIPVYGRSVMVIANEEGEALGIATDVKDIPENLNLDASISQSQVESVINEYLRTTYTIDDEYVEIPQITKDNLVIYDLEENIDTRLAYQIDVYVGGQLYVIIVDAHSAEILDFQETASDLTGVCESTGKKAPVWDEPNEDGFFLYDDQNNIYIFNARKITVNDKNRANYKVINYVTSEDDLIFGNTDKEKEQEPEKGFDLINNIISYVGYYKELDPSPQFDDCIAFYNDGYQWGTNAKGGYLKSTRTGTMSIGYNRSMDNHGVLMHEFTHMVQYLHHSSISKNSEAKAILEGLGDVFGCFYTNKWVIETENSIIPDRDAISPKKGTYATKLSDKVDSALGYQYDYATLFSHCAYLMKKENVFNDFELQLLWYKTMISLPQECTFNRFRTTMESIANISGCTQAQKSVIAGAFDAVEIKEHNYNNNFNLTVLDSEGYPFAGYKVIISGEEKHFWGTQNVSQEVDSPKDGITNLNLKNGTYSLKISDPFTDYSSTIHINVDKSYQENSLIVSGFNTAYTPKIEVPEQASEEENVSEDEEAITWQNEYINYLKRMMDISEVAGFLLFDLDGDPIPEMLIRRYEHSAATVVSWDGEIIREKDLGEFSSTIDRQGGITVDQKNHLLYSQYISYWGENDPVIYGMNSTYDITVMSSGTSIAKDYAVNYLFDNEKPLDEKTINDTINGWNQEANPFASILDIQEEEEDEAPEIQQDNDIVRNFTGTWQTAGQDPYQIRYTFDEQYRYGYSCDTPGNYYLDATDPVTYEKTDYGYYVSVFTSRGTGGYRLYSDDPNILECIGDGDPYSLEGYSGTSSLLRIEE